VDSDAPHVLLVEDDATLSEVVAGYLARAGLRPTRVGDGLEALRAAERDPPDLVLLDLMLPSLDGVEVFRRLRASRPGLPVIMLTARGEEDDRILGLAMGADDYVTKPFSARELVLRVESVLRRARRTPDDASPKTLHDGDLTIDLIAHTVTRDDLPLATTGREFDLLVYFVQHPGVAFTREALMREVWGWEFGDQSTVTVHVRRLRTKVEVDPGEPRRLTTVWGIGYRWEQPA
jgi:two-component system, OmpR family, response regulator ResD